MSERVKGFCFRGEVRGTVGVKWAESELTQPVMESEKFNPSSC